MLTTWLFERSHYLKPILESDSAAARQQLVAIYQLLKVCGEYMALGDSSRKQFLARFAVSRRLARTRSIARFRRKQQNWMRFV